MYFRRAPGTLLYTVFLKLILVLPTNLQEQRELCQSRLCKPLMEKLYNLFVLFPGMLPREKRDKSSVLLTGCLFSNIPLLG
jgi:hypothetical protein